MHVTHMRYVRSERYAYASGTHMLMLKCIQYWMILQAQDDLAIRSLHMPQKAHFHIAR